MYILPKNVVSLSLDHVCVCVEVWSYKTSKSGTHTLVHEVQWELLVSWRREREYGTNTNVIDDIKDVPSTARVGLNMCPQFQLHDRCRTNLNNKRFLSTSIQRFLTKVMEFKPVKKPSESNYRDRDP
jgi:hypothetical protein